MGLLRGSRVARRRVDTRNMARARPSPWAGSPVAPVEWPSALALGGWGTKTTTRLSGADAIEVEGITVAPPLTRESGPNTRGPWPARRPHGRVSSVRGSASSRCGPKPSKRHGSTLGRFGFSRESTANGPLSRRSAISSSSPTPGSGLACSARRCTIRSDSHPISSKNGEDLGLDLKARPDLETVLLARTDRQSAPRGRAPRRRKRSRRTVPRTSVGLLSPRCLPGRDRRGVFPPCLRCPGSRRSGRKLTGPGLTRDRSTGGLLGPRPTTDHGFNPGNWADAGRRTRAARAGPDRCPDYS